MQQISLRGQRHIFFLPSYSFPPTVGNSPPIGWKASTLLPLLHPKGLQAFCAMAWENRITPRLFDSKISRLNNDVLLQIFILNTKFDFDIPHIPSRTTRYTSQVSSRWRELALNSPMLWASSLNFAEKMPWIQTVLERAKSCPLNVSYPGYSDSLLYNQSTLSQWRHLEDEHRMALVHQTWHGPVDINKLETALSLFSRCRKFRLILFNITEWLHARKTPTSLTAPHLEEMILVVNVAHLQYRSNTPAKESSIFDLGNPTKLKTLHLSGYGLPMPAVIKCKTLTMLIIEGMEDKRSLWVDEWLLILDCFPQLEVLHLTDCFNGRNRGIMEEDSENLDLGPLLSFSKLRSIKLEGFGPAVFIMLSRIQFPPSCAINLGFSQVDYLYTSLASKTLSLLQDKIRDFVANSQKVVSLSLFFRRYMGLGWKFWNNIHRADETPLCVTWMPEDETGEEHLHFEGLKQILEIMSPTVRSLYLDMIKIGDHESAYDRDLGVFQTFQNVKSISIPSTGALKYVWMHVKDDHAASHKLPTLVLPALQIIVLGSLVITKKINHRICEIFTIRVKSGAAIPTCHVKHCEGKALRSLIKELKKIGVQVEWDGKTVTAREKKRKEEDILAHLTVQSEWDGFYKDDGDNVYDSDGFNSDIWDVDEDDD